MHVVACLRESLVTLPAAPTRLRTSSCVSPGWIRATWSALGGEDPNDAQALNASATPRAGSSFENCEVMVCLLGLESPVDLAGVPAPFPPARIPFRTKQSHCFGTSQSRHISR